MEYKFNFANNMITFFSFEELFSGEEEMKSIDHAMDCTSEEMQQFIKFMYTGELEGLASHELMQLAAKYEIKTLEDICKSAFKEAYAFTLDKLAMMALHLECGSHPICLHDEADENKYVSNFLFICLHLLCILF